MVTFGADPDAASSGWDEPEPRMSAKARPAIFSLVSYFAYHPQMKMSQRMDDQDKAILSRLFRKRLDQGFSVDSIKKMIDRFYQSWAAEATMPVLTFSSNKVQSQLMEEVEVSQADPVLEWLLSGMPSDGPFDNPQRIRRSVLLNAGDALMRYPDVVASILHTDDAIDECLLVLNALIAARLGRDTDIEPDLIAVCTDKMRSLLPPELLRNGVGPSTLRPQRETIQQAIIAIPSNKRVR